MARIPTIQIPQVQRAQYPGVQQNLSAAMAPLEGTMAIARSVGQIGQVAGEFSLKLARAREEATLSDNARKLNEGWGAFQAEIATEPDPTRWPTMFQKYADEAKKSADKDAARLGPDGKARLSEQVANWTSENMVRVNTQSKLGEVKEQKAKFMNAAISYAQVGDVVKAKAEVTKAWQAGTLSDAETQKAMDDMDQVSEIAQIKGLMRNDPAQAVAMLEDEKRKSSLSESDKLALKNQARVQLASERNETSQVIGEEIFNVLENGASPRGIEEKIKGLVETGKMLPSTASNHLRRLRGQTPAKEISTKVAYLHREALKLDKNSEDFIERRAFLRTELATLPEQATVDARRVLDGFDKQAGAFKADTNVREYHEELFNTGVFGDAAYQPQYIVEMEDPWYAAPRPRLGPDGKPVIARDPSGQPIQSPESLAAEARYEKAWSEYGTFLHDFDEFLKTDPSIDEQFKWTNDYTNRKRLRKAFPALNKIIGKTNARPEAQGN